MFLWNPLCCQVQFVLEVVGDGWFEVSDDVLANKITLFSQFTHLKSDITFYQHHYFFQYFYIVETLSMRRLILI